MKTIKITGNQREKLCNELARLTFELKKDENVKCIYFAPYYGLKGYTPIKGKVLLITVVTDYGISERKELAEKFKEYNALHNKAELIKDFGLKILIETDSADRYTLLDISISECRRSNALMNSYILYDGTGEFTKIKEKATKNFKNGGEIPGIVFYYDNRREIVPPLDIKLNRVINK